MSIDTILDLPVKLDLQIRSYFTPTELCKTARVCKTWQELNETNSLWNQFLRTGELESVKYSVVIISKDMEETYPQENISAKEAYLHIRRLANVGISF